MVIGLSYSEESNYSDERYRHNKHELVNVMVRKMDGAYLAGHISKAENIHTWWPITYWCSITGKCIDSSTGTGNNNTLGNARHLATRTHLTRCHIALGDITLAWCPTEWQMPGLFTKVVSAAQEKGLLPRFYNDCVTTEGTASISE
jgi:hypothetical protein